MLRIWISDLLIRDLMTSHLRHGHLEAMLDLPVLIFVRIYCTDTEMRNFQNFKKLYAKPSS